MSKNAAKVTDKGDGNYVVNYEPTAAGNHKIAVTLKDAHVAKVNSLVLVLGSRAQKFVENSLLTTCVWMRELSTATR